MKKFFLSILVLILFQGCQKKEFESSLTEWMKMNGKVKILSTIAQIGDLVQAVGGDRIDSLVLIPSDLNPHSYDLVKGDGEKISRADLIFYNGLGLEHGASLASQLLSKPNAVPLGDRIKILRPEKILMKGGVPDPHVWMDVSFWKQAVGVIVEQLKGLDPQGAAYYKERALLLENEMNETHLHMRRLLQEVPSNKRFLVTSHDAFRYFATAYLADEDDVDKECRVAAPEGLAPDGQLSPIDIQRTIQFLKNHQIHVIFPESNVSRDAVMKAAAASREFGYEVKLCPQPLYGDSTSGCPYIEMMRRNAEVIASFLQQEGVS